MPYAVLSEPHSLCLVIESLDPTRSHSEHGRKDRRQPQYSGGHAPER
jgi:hypothetical protein